MSNLILIEEVALEDGGIVLIYDCHETQSGLVCDVLATRLGDKADVQPDGGRIRVIVPDNRHLDTVKEAVSGIDSYFGS